MTNDFFSCAMEELKRRNNTATAAIDLLTEKLFSGYCMYKII
jgi:hypothetical protein